MPTWTVLLRVAHLAPRQQEAVFGWLQTGLVEDHHLTDTRATLDPDRGEITLQWSDA